MGASAEAGGSTPGWCTWCCRTRSPRSTPCTACATTWQRPLKLHSRWPGRDGLDEPCAAAAGAGLAQPGRALHRQVPARAVRRPAAARRHRPRPRRASPGCCSPTSRSPCWTCRSGSASSTCSDDLRDRERLAILYVTHDIASARYLADTITGDVRRPGGRVRPGHADHRLAGAPVHPAAAQRRARPGPGRAAGAARPRLPAEPGERRRAAAGSTRAARYAMAICAEHRTAGRCRSPPTRQPPAGCTPASWTPGSPRRSTRPRPARQPPARPARPRSGLPIPAPLWRQHPNLTWERRSDEPGCRVAGTALSS